MLHDDVKSPLYQLHKKKGCKALNKLCEEESRSCPLIELRLPLGDPVKNIIEHVEKENADLVIISKHGLGRKEELRPGRDRKCDGSGTPLYQYMSPRTDKN
ncbi:MAG TPA: hypothetical protein DCS48_04590 [Desulfovibrio sp.]|nr:hypothetical protein [Desulfovibrio sp.]